MKQPLGTGSRGKAKAAKKEKESVQKAVRKNPIIVESLDDQSQNPNDMTQNSQKTSKSGKKRGRKVTEETKYLIESE